MGGRSVTADLGIVLRVTPDVAESVKFRYGSAMPMDVDPDEVLQVTSIGEETSHGVTRRHIAEIVESRVTEILKFVGAEIEAAGATNRLQAGLVLTGGGSLLDGVTRAARDQLGMSARVVGPRGLGGLTDQIATPPSSAATGAVTAVHLDPTTGRAKKTPALRITRTRITNSARQTLSVRAIVSARTE